MKKKVIYENEIWEMDNDTEHRDDNVVRIYRTDRDGRQRWKYVSRGSLGSYNYFWQVRESFLHYFHNKQ